MPTTGVLWLISKENTAHFCDHLSQNDYIYEPQIKTP
jgi:hypothetical protein